MTHVDCAKRRKAIIKHIKKHFNCTLAAKEFGISVNHTSVIAKQTGIIVRKRPDKYPSEIPFTILKRLIDGVSTNVIMQELSITKQYISLIRGCAEKVGIL